MFLDKVVELRANHTFSNKNIDSKQIGMDTDIKSDYSNTSR